MNASKEAPSKNVPVYRSDRSKGKIVHLESCRYLKRIPENRRIRYESFASAGGEGCRFCRICSPVLSGYQREKEKIDSICRENGLTCIPVNESLHIHSRYDFWRIIPDPESVAPALYHRNKRAGRKQPKRSEIYFYHRQNVHEKTLPGLIRYILKHDLYTEKKNRMQAELAKKEKKTKKSMRKKARRAETARVLALMDEMRAAGMM